MIAPDVVAFVRASLGPEPLRVLEVGAGDGSLAVALRGAGHDVVAVDPAAETDGVRPVALLDVDEPAASFDAAVAITSLHHLEPLAESLAHLGALVRPGGTLVVDEIDVEVLDERAARWWVEQRVAAGGADHLPDPATLPEQMRDHIHSLAAVRAGLEAWFGCGEPVRGPYLYRWSLPPGLHDAEVELIAAGELPAFGARFLARRR